MVHRSLPLLVAASLIAPTAAFAAPRFTSAPGVTCVPARPQAATVHYEYLRGALHNIGDPEDGKQVFSVLCPLPKASAHPSEIRVTLAGDPGEEDPACWLYRTSIGTPAPLPSSVTTRHGDLTTVTFLVASDTPLSGLETVSCRLRGGMSLAAISLLSE